MKDTDIIKACAELDEHIQRVIYCPKCQLEIDEDSDEILGEPPGGLFHVNCGYDQLEFRGEIDFKPYLTSHDAIVPVIEKVLTGKYDLQEKMWEYIMQYGKKPPASILTTPRQLCIALLRATGKWVEEGEGQII